MNALLTIPEARAELLPKLAPALTVEFATREIFDALRQAEAVIFPVHHRPVEGTRGPYRVTMRHGVSRIRSGRRFTLGLVFHDAA